MEHLKGKRIKLRNTETQPLSEREIVEATVAFANGATLELKDFAEGRSSQPSEEETTPSRSDSWGEPRTAEQIREDERRVTRELLSYILSGPMLEEDVNGLTDQDLSSLINPRPFFRKVDGGLTLRFAYSFCSDSDLTTLGVILLEDTERPFKEKLCQCRLESCGLFFFEVKPPTGRPQRKYCSEEHMLMAHDQNAPNRMKKRRRRSPAGKK
jgi:hypothetical protein